MPPAVGSSYPRRVRGYGAPRGGGVRVRALEWRTAVSPVERREWRSEQKLGLFGGSFDPVHRGHEHVARAAARAFGLDHVVWMPAARPPHKPERILAEAADRVAMLELALAGEPRWSVSTLELERSGPSFTIDTVHMLPRALGLAPDVEIHLLFGGDNLAGFGGWREAEELLRRAQPVIVVRQGDERSTLERLAAGLAPELAAKLARGLVVAPLVPISSTELRERVSRGEDVGDALAPAVAEYVRSRGIYTPRRA
jgi:nicotinate-nucleotide adenylyltransferase